MNHTSDDDHGDGNLSQQHTSHEEDDRVQVLVDILGGQISIHRARELLEAAGNGSIEQAVELHYFFLTNNATSTCGGGGGGGDSNDDDAAPPGSQGNHTVAGDFADLSEDVQTSVMVESTTVVHASPAESVVAEPAKKKDFLLSSVNEKWENESKGSSMTLSVVNCAKKSANNRKRRLQSSMDAFISKSPARDSANLKTDQGSIDRKENKTLDVLHESSLNNRLKTHGDFGLSQNHGSIKVWADAQSPAPDASDLTTINVPQSRQDKFAGKEHSSFTGESSSNTAAVEEKTTYVVGPFPGSRKHQTNQLAPESHLIHSTISYSMVVQHLATVSGTTKRTLKLQALQSLYREALDSVGYRGPDHDPELIHKQARRLHMTLDLILGKLTIMTVSTKAKSKSNHVAAASAPTADDSAILNLTLQVSGSAVSKALQIVLGLSSAQMRQSYRRLGDLGDVAAEALGKKTSVKSFFQPVVSSKNNSLGNGSPSKVLSVEHVHECLQALATVSPGKGSLSARQDILVKLFRAGQKDEDTIRFLVRTVIGCMRLGATLKTVLAALAMTIADLGSGLSHVDTKSDKDDEQVPKLQLTSTVADRLQKVYNVCPRLDKICLALLEGGIERAEASCSLTLGCPIEPMLANPAHSFQQVEEFLRKSKGSAAIAEWKYDGVRCQAHFRRGNNSQNESSVKLFSRHLLDQSDKYPDVAAYFVEAAGKDDIHVDSFICDAEIVAVQPLSDTTNWNSLSSSSFRLLPFQDLRRGTAKAADNNRNRGQVRVYCFDLLYINGQSLLKSPLWKRRQALRKHFHETTGFAFAQATDIAPLPLSTWRFDEELVTRALTEAVEGGAEGLMMKLTGEYCCNERAESPTQQVAPGFYESGTRSHEWLKVKRDYVGGSFADTIDVVPIGAWYGNGRKAKAGYLSPVLLAIYDEEDGVFRSISRCMSFSDSMYEAMKNFYFHGIPYPMASGSDDAVTASGALREDIALNDEDNASGGGDSDQEHDDELEENNDNDGRGVAASDEGDSFASMVNCFPTRPPSTVIVTNENPPIWFKPMEVFEVSFADLSISRSHTAAAGLIMDKEGRGIALRFPRFKRRRPDKKPEQASTAEQIAQLFYQQSKMAYSGSN